MRESYNEWDLIKTHAVVYKIGKCRLGVTFTVMAKLLGIKDYILISGALVGDVIEGARSVGGIVPFFREISYGYAPPGARRTSYLSSVSRLLSVGDIERKTDAEGRTYLELTSKGIEKYKRKFPLFLREREKWDRNFMVVIFDIKEIERIRRDVLRLKLRQLGFGMMQESVYISPYHFEEDLREYLELKGLGRYVFVFKAESLGLGDYRSLAEKIWKLSDIDKKYREVLADFGTGRKTIGEMWQKYLAVLYQDPLLPRDLLPENWSRNEVVKKLELLGLTK